VTALEFHPQTEQLDLITDSEQLHRLGLALQKGEFRTSLGSYDRSQHQIWTQLSNFISKDLLDRLTPAECSVGKLSSQSYKLRDKYLKWDTKPQLSSERPFALNASDSNPLFSDSSTELNPLKEHSNSNATDSLNSIVSYSNYTLIPTLSSYCRAQHLTNQPQVITQLSQDQSPLLEHLLTLYSSEEQLLGECQFAFIDFFISQHLEGFEQWKCIPTLVCQCSTSLCRRTEFFVSFVNVVINQLAQMSSDLFENELFAEVSQKRLFLFVSFRSLYERVNEMGVSDIKLSIAVNRLADFCQTKFCWNIKESSSDVALEQLQSDEESDEYAPIVVDLDQ